MSDIYRERTKTELCGIIAELETENDELRKQNEILATTRRLEEEARQQAEATIERLKVCGSCHMWNPVPDADDTYCCTCIIIGADPARAFDTCSRWAARGQS